LDKPGKVVVVENNQYWIIIKEDNGEHVGYCKLCYVPFSSKNIESVKRRLANHIVLYHGVRY